MRGHRLAVWGDPISHSRSPQVHAAAYARLGLDWEYGRRQVSAEGFASAIASLDDTWRGLSVTMPLKEEAFRAAGFRDGHAELTGAVNTLLLGEDVRGYNTDVGGIVDALREHGVEQLGTVRILGAGATAASALVAAGELGLQRAQVLARRPGSTARLAAIGDRLGIAVEASGFDADLGAVDATLSTLPSGAALPEDVVARLAADGGLLFDAAYSPWPSALASRWGDEPIVSGLSMLLHQAVRQVRIFLHGDASRALTDEPEVVAVMRSALMGD
ncbi:MAG: shikimate dehydrogenase family protein [Actinomycetota bacterium]